jgi:Mycoplasma protein of unknown function, DUF285
MFTYCKMMNVDFTAWDVSNVKSMTSMFEGTDSFVGTGVSQWDVSEVQSMDFMFARTTLFNADLSAWDVEDVLSMDAMFYNTLAYTAISISDWPVTVGTSMAGLLCNVTALNPFALSTMSWATSDIDCSGNFTWGTDF